ncbi:hypothetical protein ACA910_015052 [Epithemia clementina (nom. ined.)]
MAYSKNKTSISSISTNSVGCCASTDRTCTDRTLKTQQDKSSERTVDNNSVGLATKLRRMKRRLLKEAVGFMDVHHYKSSCITQDDDDDNSIISDGSGTSTSSNTEDGEAGGGKQ